MSFLQRVSLTTGGVVILGMALFPPWLFVYRYPEIPPIERPAGYHSLFGQHVPQDQQQVARLFGATTGGPIIRFISLRIDITRLAVQILATILLTSLLYLATRPRKAVISN